MFIVFHAREDAVSDHYRWSSRRLRIYHMLKARTLARIMRQLAMGRHPRRELLVRHTEWLAGVNGDRERRWMMASEVALDQQSDTWIVTVKYFGFEKSLAARELSVQFALHGERIDRTRFEIAWFGDRPCAEPRPDDDEHEAEKIRPAPDGAPGIVQKDRRNSVGWKSDVIMDFQISTPAMERYGNMDRWPGNNFDREMNSKKRVGKNRSRAIFWSQKSSGSSLGLVADASLASRSAGELTSAGAAPLTASDAWSWPASHIRSSGGPLRSAHPLICCEFSEYRACGDMTEYINISGTKIIHQWESRV